LRVELFPVYAIQFVIAVNDIPDLAVDQCFSLADKIDEIIFIDVAGKHQVDHGAIETVGELADKVYFAYFPETFDDGVDDGIEADVFDEDVVDIPVEWVCGVGLEEFLVAFGEGVEQAGFFESVEFLADGIGGISEFGFQSAEV
jgi:hypothetical protein